MSKLFDYDMKIDDLKTLMLKFNINPTIISNIKTIVTSHIYISYHGGIPTEYIYIKYIDIFNQYHNVSSQFDCYNIV